MRDWRGTLDILVYEIPDELMGFYFDQPVLDNPAYGGFGAELLQDTIDTFGVRSRGYGERAVLHCIVDHLISEPDETLGRFATAQRKVSSPEVLRRLLREIRDAVWPGAKAVPPISLIRGARVVDYRAERHRRARLEAGLPW